MTLGVKTVAIKDALADAIHQLDAAGIGAARISAESLMMFTLNCDRAHLLSHPERELTSAQQSAFTEAINQRAIGTPLQYITGHQEFWGLDFLVNPSVLIPRPETEHLVEAALNLLRSHAKEPSIIDVGTGSGCIILAIAHSLAAKTANAEFHATDISEQALKVARENAQRLKPDAINFRCADLLEAETQPFDFIVSNPPYVGLNEQDKVQREVREHEPKVAVFAGDEGLSIYRRLIPQAHALLRPDGWLLMEIGYSMEEKVRALLALHSWSETRTIPDLQGIPRVLLARK